MKRMNQILFGSIIASSLSFAVHADAQFKANQGDGIAASPKVRQMLNDRKASQTAATLSKNASTTGVCAGYRAVGSDNIAASPKVRQMLDEQRASSLVTTPTQEATSVAGYQVVGNDGIAASPKVRQQLDERGATLMIAPVK